MKQNKKIKQKLKLKIISGYPPKTFKFTGMFHKRELGHYGATKNKKIVYIPIYKNNDDEILLDMNQQYNKEEIQ